MPSTTDDGPGPALPAPEALRAALVKHRRMRARDLAERLGVPEAALLAARVGQPPEPRSGQRVLPVAAAPDRLIAAAEGLGPVLALTRNDACVHEREGRYSPLVPEGETARVDGAGIALRLHPVHWVHGFALTGPRPSLQVFDAAGDAVHKIHLREAPPDSPARAAFDRVVGALTLPGAWRIPAFAARPPAPDPQPQPALAEPLRAADAAGLEALLQRHGLSRLAAWRSLGAPLAERLAPGALAQLLSGAAEEGAPLTVVVANPGCTQTHAGPVRRFMPTKGWLNILDPEFNLHLRSDRVAEVWRIGLPDDTGPAPAIEAFDPAGRLVLTLRGQPDSPPGRWQALAECLAPV